MTTEEKEKRPRGRGRPRSAETAFSKWIDESPRFTRKRMADELGVTLLYVNDLCSGRRVPSLALKKSIARLTRGGFKEEMWEAPSPKGADEKSEVAAPLEDTQS